MDLEKLTAVVDKLTWKRIALGVAGGLSGVFVYHVWESRSTFVPSVLANNTALGVVGLSVGGIAVWLTGTAMVERMDRKGEALDVYLRDQVRQLTARLDAAEREREEMQAKIADVQRAEAVCTRRLQRAEYALRKSGQLPPSSDYGDLT